MTPSAELGEGRLHGGVLDFEVANLLLEGGDSRSIRSVTAGYAAVAGSEKPISGTSALYINLHNLIKGRTFDITIHQRLRYTTMFSEARNVHIAFQHRLVQTASCPANLIPILRHGCLFSRVTICTINPKSRFLQVLLFLQLVVSQ